MPQAGGHRSRIQLRGVQHSESAGSFVLDFADSKLLPLSDSKAQVAVQHYNLRLLSFEQESNLQAESMTLSLAAAYVCRRKPRCVVASRGATETYLSYIPNTGSKQCKRIEREEALLIQSFKHHHHHQRLNLLDRPLTLCMAQM